MSYNLFSFTGQNGTDPTAQAGYNQYIQQGQNLISPGQAQVGASNPIAMAGRANLANAFQQDAQIPQLPADISQQALAQGAANNPNMNGQNMGGVGPTPQNLALAQALMKPSDYQGMSY